MGVAISFLDDPEFLDHFFNHFHYWKEREGIATTETNLSHEEIVKILCRAAEEVQIDVKLQLEDDRDWIVVTAKFPIINNSEAPPFEFERKYPA